MTDLSDLLLPETVFERLAAANKKALFQQLATAAAAAYGLDATEIVERLNAREKLGSTGFGSGVATPHAKIPGLKLANCYGATETTSPSTMMPGELTASHIDSVGLPCPGADIIAVDSAGRELPRGEIGEI